MRIRIEVESKSSEYSTHLRKGFLRLVGKLGFTITELTSPNKFGVSQEWTTLEVWGDAPGEQLVDKIFAGLRDS